MATPAVIRVEGADKLRAGLKRAGHTLEDGKAVHKEIAEVVVAAADVPRGETGQLEGTVRPGATARASIVRAGKASVPYAAVDHYGDRHQNITPNPWLLRAAQGSESTWYPLYEKYVETALDRIQGAT